MKMFLNESNSCTSYHVKLFCAFQPSEPPFSHPGKSTNTQKQDELVQNTKFKELIQTGQFCAN